MTFEYVPCLHEPNGNFNGGVAGYFHIVQLAEVVVALMDVIDMQSS